MGLWKNQIYLYQSQEVHNIIQGVRSIIQEVRSHYLREVSSIIPEVRSNIQGWIVLYARSAQLYSRKA